MTQDTEQDTVIFVQGRSIDGAVFWTGTGWSSDLIGAIEMRTVQAAQLAADYINEQQGPNCSLDDRVGQIGWSRHSKTAVDLAYHTAMEEDARLTQSSGITANFSEDAELAMTYSADGAFHSAARVLRELTDRVQEHANRVQPPEPVEPKTPAWRTLKADAQEELAMAEMENVQSCTKEIAHENLDNMDLPELAELGLMLGGNDQPTKRQIAAWIKKNQEAG